VKLLRGYVGSRALLGEGKLHCSQRCDYHAAHRISLFTQLLIKFQKQVCYSEGDKEIPRFFVGPRNFITALKTAPCFALSIALLRHDT